MLARYLPKVVQLFEILVLLFKRFSKSFSLMVSFLLIFQGLEIPNTTPAVHLRRPQSHTSSDRTSSYRFSMANLEETHEAELDAILGELSLLEQKNTDRMGRTHSRSNSTISAVTNSTISSISTSSESGTGSGSDSALREPRTDSPDNDSAFSDTVSLLSSESSASSGVSSAHSKNLPLHSNLLQVSLAELYFSYTVSKFVY